MTWLSLVLVGTFFTAASSIVDKKVMNGHVVPPFACAVSFGMVALPVAIVGLTLLPAPAWPQTLLGILAGLIFVPAAWLYYDTLAREDVSRVVPILRLTSLQTLLLGVLFLGEILSGRQWIAFFLLLFSGVLLSFKLGKSGISWSWSLLRMLPATTLLAMNGILLAGVYRATSVWVGITWDSVGMVVGVVILCLIQASMKRSWSSGTSRQAWIILIGDQTVRMIVQVTTALAIAHGMPVALTSTLSSANLVWVLLLAITLLKERTGYNDVILKCSGIVGMCLGVCLLR